MYISTEVEYKNFKRISKLGKEHEYYRKSSVAKLRCDNCSVIFTRQIGKMDPKRLSNNYFHCCQDCNSKKFAQRKGVERRTIWDKSVNSDLDISRL